MTERRIRYRYRRAEHQQQRLLAPLLKLYQLLRTPRPIDELLHAILATAIGAVPGAHRGSLIVADGDVLTYRAAIGYDLEQLRPVRFPLDLVRDTVLGGSPNVQVNDFTEWDDRYLGEEAYRILVEHGFVTEIRRSLVTAVFVDGRFYGTLVLDNLHSHAPFPDNAAALAGLFAAQAGALIAQAQLIEQLRQTNQVLIESERLAGLGRFIAGIAHEINNPLTAVLGYADLLSTASLSDEEQHMLSQLRAGADRVRTIVRNLQMFARQQKSGSAMVYLNMLVEQTVMLKRADLALDQIEVLTDLEELPPIWADAGQLGQVLLNMLVNAQLALRECDPPRELSISTRYLRETPERVRLIVADNGPGMEPRIQARVFEPFFSTRSAGEGTGLGLSICAAIVSDHGGTISVDSQPGAGARFTVDLPIRPAMWLPAGEEAQVEIQSPRGYAMLLIDDDPAVIAVVRSALGRYNRLVVAANGREGLQLAEPQHFDVLLCDLRMPEMDGSAFYRTLASIRPDLAARVLFISGDTSSEATQAFLGEIRRPLLVKPFTPAELYQAISGLLAAGAP